VVVDDDDAKLTGEWMESGAAQTFIGNGYRHEDNTKDGKASARFEAKLPKAGKYEVRPSISVEQQPRDECHGGDPARRRDGD
jgi:hypothetical protein